MVLILMLAGLNFLFVLNIVDFLLPCLLFKLFLLLCLLSLAALLLQLLVVVLWLAASLLGNFDSRLRWFFSLGLLYLLRFLSGFIIV